MWELDHKEGWVLKNWCFWTMILDKTLESPLEILKEISPEYSLEGLMLNLKLQSFGYLIRRTDSFEKTLDGITDSNGHEFEQAPGVDNGQGGLACCSPWGCKELDRTEELNWTENYICYDIFCLKVFILHFLIFRQNWLRTNWGLYRVILEFWAEPLLES